jgi:hypothetical protein
MQKTLERYLFGLHAERSKTEGSNNVEKAKTLRIGADSPYKR